MSEEDEATPTSDRPGLRRTARLEAFSDGVSAIAITDYLDRADTTLLRLNLLLLFVSFLPFPTRMLSAGHALTPGALGHRYSRLRIHMRVNQPAIGGR